MTSYQIVLEVYIEAESSDEAQEIFAKNLTGGIGYEVIDVFEDEV